MENASKALIMAGSVLMAVLIIGVLIYSYNKIVAVKKTEASAEEVKELADFNRQIDSFNRASIYGSELLSLANLIKDYNDKNPEDLTGYEAIDFTVNLNDLNGTYNTYFHGGTYTDIPTFLKEFNALENRVRDWENGYEVVGGIKRGLTFQIGTTSNSIIRTAQQIVGTTIRERRLLIETYEPETVATGMVDYRLSQLDDFIQEYSELKDIIVKFKNGKFTRDAFETNSQNGRVTNVVFSGNI